MKSLFHSCANRLASLLMKLLFGWAARIHVIGREKIGGDEPFLLAGNHISHFDPFILSSIVRRKIDWMAMAEFFPHPLLGFLLRAVDAFPANRDRADRATIRTAIDRLKDGRIVGIFPEGGIRDGERSILGGAPAPPGASTLAQIAGVPIVPFVIIGSDRLYSRRSWAPLQRTPIWIAFGDRIPNFPELGKSAARTRMHQELAAAFKILCARLQETFMLSADDLPHPPRVRMANGQLPRARLPSLHPAEIRRVSIHSLRRIRPRVVDSLMCASLNFVQSRHRLHARSRDELECYITECEKITARDFYATPVNDGITAVIRSGQRSTVTWLSPIETQFPRNNIARADFFPCLQGWRAPTVFMLHALMSASAIGYRRWASRLNKLGWNACFVHLPYHYSRVPPGYWNGELAITADLIRNAQGLRQGVLELRQLMAALRQHGCREFGLLGTSYGGWIGALLASVERDFRFVALMAPIVNVEHVIWESPASAFMRSELQRAKIDPPLVARHFHLSSPLEHEPLCPADRILFVAGDFDAIARPADIEAIHKKWHGSELLHVRQGHFGYRMLPETMDHLKRRGL
jgi:1-acyl-sn-glycerol-3-phosphate acyltransferase